VKVGDRKRLRKGAVARKYGKRTEAKEKKLKRKNVPG